MFVGQFFLFAAWLVFGILSAWLVGLFVTWVLDGAGSPRWIAYGVCFYLAAMIVPVTLAGAPLFGSWVDAFVLLGLPVASASAGVLGGVEMMQDTPVED